MMSNLGGALGLYIGMSFVTFFEIGELICDVIFLAWFKLKERRKVQDDNQSEIQPHKESEGFKYFH